MIISCDACEKKFEIESRLIPSEGRTLQCGSCKHTWHFKPIIKNKKKIILKELNDYVENKVPEKTEEFIYEAEKSITKNDKKIDNKRISILSFLIVFIITIISLIILGDTFKNSIKIFIPGFDLILYNLYESLKDIILFFIDLLK